MSCWFFLFFFNPILVSTFHCQLKVFIIQPKHKKFKDKIVQLVICFKGRNFQTLTGVVDIEIKTEAAFFDPIGQALLTPPFHFYYGTVVFR